MKILSTVALLVVLCHSASASTSTSAAEPSPYVVKKATTVDRALGLLGQLAQVARKHESHYPDAATQSAIRDLLKPVASVEDLSRFARLAAALNGGLAEHQNYDSIFDYAQWTCIEKIAAIPGEDAQVQLEHVLRPILGADGHSSEMFSELVAKQMRLWKPDPKK